MLVKGWSYDTKTGILTLTANGFISQKFDIGLGYDPSKFEVCTDNSVGIVSVIKGSIKYNGPCPHAGRPSVCQICPGVPTPPVITSSATAITSTQSKTTSSSSTSSIATTSTTSSKPKPTTVSTSSIASTTTPDGSYSTSFVTVTAETTKVVTITSCSNNACHPTTAPTGLTVVTLTTSDVKTVVTTYCPLTQTVTLVLPVPRLSIWVAQPVTLVTTGTLVKVLVSVMAVLLPVPVLVSKLDLISSKITTFKSYPFCLTNTSLFFLYFSGK